MHHCNNTRRTPLAAGTTPSSLPTTSSALESSQTMSMSYQQRSNSPLISCGAFTLRRAHGHLSYPCLQEQALFTGQGSHAHGHAPRRESENNPNTKSTRPAGSRLFAQTHTTGINQQCGTGTLCVTPPHHQQGNQHRPLQLSAIMDWNLMGQQFCRATYRSIADIPLAHVRSYSLAIGWRRNLERWRLFRVIGQTQYWQRGLAAARTTLGSERVCIGLNYNPREEGLASLIDLICLSAYTRLYFGERS